MAKFLDIPASQFMGAVFELILYGTSALISRNLTLLTRCTGVRRPFRWYHLGIAKAETRKECAHCQPRH
jgi:hypothetical protein